MREEDYDPARLPKGYSFEHGRITRLQKSDRPPDVLPEVWSTLNKAQKKAARKHYAETVAAEAAPVPPTPAIAPALSMSAVKAAPETTGSQQSRAPLAPAMPCCALTGAIWKHRKKWDVQSPRSGLALVARPVKAKEIASDAAAKAAIDAERASLRAMKTWEEDKVREWSDVARMSSPHQY